MVLLASFDIQGKVLEGGLFEYRRHGFDLRWFNTSRDALRHRSVSMSDG